MGSLNSAEANKIGFFLFIIDIASWEIGHNHLELLQICRKLWE